jgi:hypothetical protein
MKTYNVVAQFTDKPQKAGEISRQYTKTFGPFSERRTAEACIVQLAGQASCQSAEVQETETPD